MARFPEGHKDLTLTQHRSYYKPFKYPWAYDAWLLSEQSHWLPHEVPLMEDVKEWNTKLTKEEKYFLTNIFRFFTQGDIDVAAGYVNEYLPLFPQPEIRMMLSSFAAREAVHIAAYSHLIESLGLPETTYNEFLQYKEMQDKHEYLNKIGHSGGSNIEWIAQKIALFSGFTEGLQLFSSFIMLLNFPRHGKLRGMGQIIQWSVVDETHHTESMIKLCRTFIEEKREFWNEKTKSEIYNVAATMVDLEDKFIDLAFNMGPMENLTSEDVRRYIRYIADRRLISLGLKGIFKVKKNPLLWVEQMINAPGHSNFFEIKSSDYAKGTLTGNWDTIWGSIKE